MKKYDEKYDLGSLSRQSSDVILCSLRCATALALSSGQSGQLDARVSTQLLQREARGVHWDLR